MGLTLAIVVPAIAAGVMWLIKPEWRGRRLFTRWLFITIATMLVFILVELFVHPALQK
jgi:hypothetical protein